MIIKGHARGRSQQLAAHLLRTDENERVKLIDCRGTVAQDVPGALAEMEALSSGARSGRPLYHASISPEASTPLTEQQMHVAADRLERRLGLNGRPRLIVLHGKGGREHLHVVWSRIDVERGVAINDSWNYRQHEAVARELEQAFGHRPQPGSRVRSRSGRCTAHDYEYRQTARSETQPSVVAAELTAIWETALDSDSFQRQLKAAGFVLARGDRRVFVVVDRNGEVHSLARRIIGADTHEIRRRLRDVAMASLPSVADVRAGRAIQPARNVPASFSVAAQETAMPMAVLRGRSATLPHCLFAVAMLRPAFLRATTPIGPWIQRRPIIRSEGLPPGLTTNYQGLRALIVADYATKIALACQGRSKDHVDAIISALRAARQAALDDLTRRQAAGSAQNQSRRRPKPSAKIRVRSRI